MTKDERILAKVGKLLLKYGVTDEEKEKFLLDLKEVKDDETEEVKEPENEVEPETEEKPEGEEKPETEEVAEVGEEAEEGKEVEGEQPEKEVVEQPEPQPDYQAKINELEKLISAQVARIDELEAVITKLGIPEPEVGLAPDQSAGNPPTQSYFDEVVSKRTGH